MSSRANVRNGITLILYLIILFFSVYSAPLWQTIKQNMLNIFMNHKTTFFFSSFCLIFFTASVNAANIVASLDRNPVMLDESFRLVLEADGPVDQDPNFSVLQNDFEILSQSQSTNMTFINGALSRKGVWNLALMGKKPGTFTIPSIPFGKDRSPALRITIKEATANANPSAGGSEIYLEAEVDQKNPWVQSQVLYTVRLFSRLSISNLRHSEPKTSDPDAIIEQLGEASTFEVFKGGVRFAVQELRFAVYPQHSGELIFSPMMFEGRITRNNAQSIFDQFMNAGELKRIRSDSININVKPIPSNIKASDWVPASKLSLIEEWSDDVQQLKTGDPVTRTITLLAEGPLAANLPDLNLDEIQDIKQYPDKPVIQNKATAKGVSSSKQIKVALIPTKAGDYKLPAISIPWWNTKTGRQEVARLPETLLKATGIANTPVAPPVASTPLAQPEPVPQESTKGTTGTLDSLVNAGYLPMLWPWISLALAIGWLITLIAFLRKGERTPKIKHTPTPSLQPLEKAVQKHSSNNDAHNTMDALLEWAKVRWPEKTIASLVDIAELSHPELGEQLQALNTSLYSPDHQPWHGKKLAKAFDNFRRQKPERDNTLESALKPLYKTTN